MSQQATRDTEPELALRRRLHATGYRFRVDFAPLARLRRKADIVFTRRKIAVFVDGCFWHSCPDHGTTPVANREWWASKLARNVERDSETNQELAAEGWTVIRIWEHVDAESAMESVEAALVDVDDELAGSTEGPVGRDAHRDPRQKEALGTELRADASGPWRHPVLEGQDGK